VKFNTTRFGDIEVDDRDVFHLPEGILGFPDLNYFVILEHNPGSPFRWLQSTEQGEMAFVVLDPLMVDNDYPMEKLRDAVSTKDRRPKDIGVAAIAVVPNAPHPITVNLLAPIVLDPEKRTGIQIILNGTGYTTRHILVQSDEPKEK